MPDTQEIIKPDVIVVSEVQKPINQKPASSNAIFNSLKLFVSLIIVVLFILLGYVIGTEVVPGFRQWLVSHNFLIGEVTSQSDVIPPIINQGTQTLSIADIVERVSPAVVSIAISDVDLSKDAGITQSSSKIGTGFIIDPSGIIVTNQHVVSSTTSDYQVITKDNKALTPIKIVRDAFNDIAFVFVDGNALQALTMGDSEKLRVGETVIAIGTPLGEFPGSVTTGVISGLGRSVQTGASFLGSSREYSNVIQTDAAVNPGNSGGPLISERGEVIGVNFATTSGADNISFALPISLIKERLAEYKQYGKLRSSYLGITYSLLTANEAKIYGTPQGALVRTIAPASPALEATIKRGDIIIKIDGKVVTEKFSSQIQKLTIGSTIEVVVWRQEGTTKSTGKEIVLSLKVGEREN